MLRLLLLVLLLTCTSWGSWGVEAYSGLPVPSSEPGPSSDRDHDPSSGHPWLVGKWQGEELSAALLRRGDTVDAAQTYVGKDTGHDEKRPLAFLGICVGSRFYGIARNEAVEVFRSQLPHPVGTGFRKRARGPPALVFSGNQLR